MLNFIVFCNVKIKGTNKELMISKVMLRSLMKAKYSEINLGHFGLGFEMTQG